MIAAKRPAPSFESIGKRMSLNGKVVVITGATSGIGRAAAIEFAAQGCRVVLAGRRLEALAEAAHECRAAGGQAVTLQTDVTREEQVEALAALALEQTGVVDIWINNAGVTLFGPLEGTPFDEHRQVLETTCSAPCTALARCSPSFAARSAAC